MKTIKKVTDKTKELMAEYYIAYSHAVRSTKPADFDAAEEIHRKVLQSIKERNACKTV